MNYRAIAAKVIGLAMSLLGLLWFLQGADLIQVRPILCLAECEPLVGGSIGWLVGGIVTSLVGMLLIHRSWSS